jgi:hypothetical protein
VVEIIADQSNTNGEASERVGIAHAEELPGTLGKGNTVTAKQHSVCLVT